MLIDIFIEKWTINTRKYSQSLSRENPITTDGFVHCIWPFSSLLIMSISCFYCTIQIGWKNAKEFCHLKNWIVINYFFGWSFIYYNKNFASEYHANSINKIYYCLHTTFATKYIELTKRKEGKKTVLLSSTAKSVVQQQQQKQKKWYRFAKR